MIADRSSQCLKQHSDQRVMEGNWLITKVRTSVIEGMCSASVQIWALKPNGEEPTFLWNCPLLGEYSFSSKECGQNKAMGGELP